MARRNRKKAVRIVLDTILTVTIVFAMFIQFTGEFLHEVIGCVFFAALVTHLALSAKWMKGTIRARRDGKLHGRRRALGVMACLLAMAMVALGMSSVAISWVLADAGFVWPLGSYALWETIHAISAYSLCALVVVHLAMHWTFFASAFKVPYDPSRRQAIGNGVKVVAAVGAVALGVAAAKEILPRQIAQASAETTGSNAPGDTQAFSAVSDSPYSGSEDSATSDLATASDSTSIELRKQEEPLQDSASVTASGEEAASEMVEEYPVEDAYYEKSTAEEVYYEQPEYVDDGAYAEASTDLGTCPLCRKACSLSNPRCDKPYQAGLI